MPRQCSPVEVDGISAIICTGGRQPGIHACIVCAGIATSLCDWKLGNRAGMSSRKTCDRAVCEEHTTEVGKNRDLCPEHAEAWEQHPANKQQKLAL